jgi:iron-sulfur cluster assembly accessory protein
MITISDIAAEKIKDILKVEGAPNSALRVTATGGGCCGPQYEIMIDDKSGDGDIVVEREGAKVFVDAVTAKALSGAELGFISDERGEGFVLGFPKGMPSGGGCGCGSGESSGGGCGSGEKAGGGCGSGESSGGCGCS